MKNKYISVFVALLIGTQSIFACEFCGAKNVAHGQTLNLAFVIARALSAFSDSYGMASLETYFNAAEGGEQEQGALNLREGGGTAETQPLYLIAENYLNTVDQQFREEIALATERGPCSAPH